MKLLIMLAIAAAILALLAWGFGWKAIDSFDPKRELKLWSTKLSLGGLVTTLSAYLGIWNMMPQDVRALVPANLLTAIGITLFACAVVATRVRQDKTRG